MVRPTKHIYDGIILHYLAKDWIRFMVAGDRMKNRRFGEMPAVFTGDSTPFPHYSISDIWRIIRDSDYMIFLSLRNRNYPKVTRVTATNHVEILEEEGALVKSHLKGAHGKTLYRLGTRKLMHYLMFLFHGIDRLMKYLIRIGKMQVVF